MKHPIPIEHDKYYHIYNRGINGETLFKDTSNYEHFLRLYDEHIIPIADTFAWVLMKNHFHFLVRIKAEAEIDYIKPKKDTTQEYPVKKKYNPSQQFGNLFNAYTKAFNKRYSRTGKLFETPFRRIQVENEYYFKQLVYYIHNNPVHHGFCDSMSEYPWSSYLTMISIKPSKIQRDTVMGWFNSKSEFIEFHNGKCGGNTVEPHIFE